MIKFSREIIVFGAVLIALIHIGVYLQPSGMPKTRISNLMGRWEGRVSDQEMVLEIESKSQCSLSISRNDMGQQFYSGKCMVDRNKAPTALSILNLPAYDFNLHTIIVRMDDKRLLVAPFSNRKRARPITFSNSFILKKI